MDYFAIRAEEYNYLIRFYTEQNERLKLDGLPNFAYSVPLAYCRLSLWDKANESLQSALLRFPSILKFLLDKLSVRADRSVENCRFFSDSERHDSDALKCVEQLYVERMSNEWKEKDELDFLRNNVNQVIRIIELNQDPRIENFTRMYDEHFIKTGTVFVSFRRKTSYRKTPMNVCRHIILSESNQIRGFLPSVSKERKG